MIEVVQEQQTILRISQAPHAIMAQIAEYQAQMAEVLGLMLTGVKFCCWIFLFSHSKASDANIAKFVCL